MENIYEGFQIPLWDVIRRICLDIEENMNGNLRSQLAEHALRADVPGALVTGLADELLQALVVGGGEGLDVALHHGDAGNGGVAHGVLLAQGAGGHRAVGERGFQGVQEVHNDVDELLTGKRYMLVAN